MTWEVDKFVTSTLAGTFDMTINTNKTATLKITPTTANIGTYTIRIMFALTDVPTTKS